MNNASTGRRFLAKDGVNILKLDELFWSIIEEARRAREIIRNIRGMWCSIKPPANRDWQPDVAQTAWTERDGDKITIHNLRNFDYETGLAPKPRWETRVVNLSDLQAVDLFINFWGSTLICHPIVSFQFGEDQHVTISVETRMAQGQSYSTIRGFFKQYNLIYIVADERDVVRVRTN